MCFTFLTLISGAQNDHYFYYVDNSRLVFSNWSPHKPNGDMSDRRCVVMQYTPTDSSDKGKMSPHEFKGRKK